jgi:hypothetical protein
MEPDAVRLSSSKTVSNWRGLDAAEAPLSASVGKRFGGPKTRHMAHLELKLSSGDTIQLNVADANAELAALKAGTGRFQDEFADLTGPAVGVVRTEAIVAVIIR